MEPHNLIPKTPSSQPHFNATYQNTIATCQNSNATQPNAGPAGSNLAVELHVDLTLLASGLDVSKRRMASIIAECKEKPDRQDSSPDQKWLALAGPLKELANPNFVLPEVGLPVWWKHPNGDLISLSDRSDLLNTHTFKGYQGPTTNIWSPDGQLPSQGSTHTGATAGPGVFAGAGSQSLIPVVSPMGYSNLGRTLSPDVNAFEPQPNAFDHFSHGTLTYMNHLAPELRYQTLTGSLLAPTSVSDGNTLVRQVNPNSTPEASLPGQTTQYRSPVSHDPWNDRVTGPAPVSNIQDHCRSTQHFSSVNTGTPVRLVDPPAVRPWPDYVRESGASGAHSDQNPPTSSGHGSTLLSSSKPSKPTASKQSTGKRPVRPPVPLADSRSISHPYTGSPTHLAPSSRAVSGRHSSPNWVPRPEDKGKRRERYD